MKRLRQLTHSIPPALIPWVKMVLKIIITLLFVWVVNRSITPNDLLQLASTSNPVLILVSIIAGFFGLMMHAFRLRIILKSHGINNSLSYAWYSILWGTFLAFMTPGRAGELFRGFGSDQTKGSESIAVVIIDKFFILYTLFFTGFIFALYGFLSNHYQINFSILFILGLIIATPLFFPLIKGMLKIIMKWVRVENYFYTIESALKKILATDGIVIFVLSFAAHAALIVQMALLLTMYSIPSWVNAAGSSVLATAIMPFASISIAEVGIREGAVAYFLNGCEISGDKTISLSAAALGMSLWIVVINYLIPATAGLVWRLLIKKRTGQHGE